MMGQQSHCCEYCEDNRPGQGRPHWKTGLDTDDLSSPSVSCGDCGKSGLPDSCPWAPAQLMDTERSEGPCSSIKQSKNQVLHGFEGLEVQPAAVSPPSSPSIHHSPYGSSKSWEDHDPGPSNLWTLHPKRPVLRQRHSVAVCSGKRLYQVNSPASLYNRGITHQQSSILSLVYSSL